MKGRDALELALWATAYALALTAVEVARSVAAAVVLERLEGGGKQADV